MSGLPHRELVLALYPSSHGFAYIYFERPTTPYDWGLRGIQGNDKNLLALTQIERLVGELTPDVIVLEDTGEPSSRRSPRIRRLYRQIVHLAQSRSIDVIRYPKSTVSNCFAGMGANTKYDIDQAIARKIPGFALRLPYVRKIWLGEDRRQSLFDAAALGLTYYSLHPSIDSNQPEKPP
jgi:hypothetical protein